MQLQLQPKLHWPKDFLVIVIKQLFTCHDIHCSDVISVSTPWLGETPNAFACC